MLMSSFVFVTRRGTRVSLPKTKPRDDLGVTAATGLEDEDAVTDPRIETKGAEPLRQKPAQGSRVLL